MALDKQSILNELGSVMNKLQSADCGCMGKLFNNSNRSHGGGEGAALGSSLPTCGGCRRGCCHGHGYSFDHNHTGHGPSTPCAGEPCGMNTPCMGHCNPPKLYADTYNYLNKNLMQPVVNEVYNDLKTITPANTVMNNSMAGQMGLSSHGGQGAPMQGDMGMPQNQILGSGMGNQMQGNMGMGQNQMPGGGIGSPMQDTMQGDFGYSGNQMMQSDLGYSGNQTMQGDFGYSGNQTMQGDFGYSGNQMPSGGIQGMSMPMNNEQMANKPMSHQQMADQKMMNVMGGMGPDIVNMIQKDGSRGAKPIGSVAPGGQLTGPMVIDAPQSPHGQVGLTPLNLPGGTDQGQYGGNMGMQHPTTQYMTEQNINNGFSNNAPNSMNTNMQQGGAVQQGHPNQAAQQMASANRNYGQHTQGIKKFNEMFPGVIGKDLGFDPMAIAIQMNPQNHQKAAMDTMEKMMNGNAGKMQPAIDGTNAAAATFAQPNTLTNNQQNIQPSNQQAMYGQHGTINQHNMQPSNQQDILQQQRVTNQQSVPFSNQHAMHAQQGAAPSQTARHQVPQQQNAFHGSQVPQQQVCTAITGAPVMNQGQSSQMQAQQIQYQTHYQQPLQQEIIDPNTGASMAPALTPINETGDGNAQMSCQPAPTETAPVFDPEDQLLIKDPIFPVDTSRFLPPPYMRRPKYYQYNTLGQPVEMLPQQMYKHSEPNLPQTLSPQPIAKLRNDFMRPNVKSTVSKTSLMGSRPVGKTPSRSQLQQVYNQYKGSHSYTQQNIRAPVQGATFSEGKLNVPQGNANPVPGRQVPVERVGGDTAANNHVLYNAVPVKGQPMEQIGDVPAMNKPHGDMIPMKEPPMRQGRLRNGLQDMVYTSHPTSAAWSFHGNNHSPFSASYRFRNRT